MNQILYSLSLLEEKYKFEIKKTVDGLECRVFNYNTQVTGWLEDVHHPDDIAEKINDIDNICNSVTDDIKLLCHFYWVAGYYHGVKDN